jgi:hypothetical protein
MINTDPHVLLTTAVPRPRRGTSVSRVLTALDAPMVLALMAGGPTLDVR